MRRVLWIALVAVLVVIAIGKPVYILQDENQVVVTRFGSIVRSHQDAGLKFKVPFLEQLTVYSERIKVYDSAPDTALTSDKRRLHLDFFVTYRISDPVLYKQKVRTTRSAQTRLDDILYSSLRNVISEHTFHDNVVDRRQVEEKAVADSRTALANFGIEVLDLQIELLNLPEANVASVYERMRSERNRIAAKYRSEGKAEAQKIEAQADRQAREIIADAQKESEEIKGEGDRERTRIYAEAFGQDADFYAFWRALETYRETLPKTQSTLFVPVDSPLGRYLIGQI